VSEKLSKAFFEAEGDPTFDLKAARGAYQWVMEHDYDEASMSLRIALFDETARDLEKYGDFVRTEVAKKAKGRLDHVRKAVAKRHVANPTQETANLLHAISKAESFIDPDLSLRARRQWRSGDGRFRVMSTSLSYGNQKKPLSGAQASRLNIPRPTEGGGTKKTVSLSREQMRNYQEAYTQISQTLRQARSIDPKAILQIHYEDGTPSKEILVNDQTQVDSLIDGNQFKSNNRIARVDVQIADDTARGAAFDVMGAMRVPAAMSTGIAGFKSTKQTIGADGQIYNTTFDAGEKISALRQNWVDDPTKDDKYLIANPSQRAYRRLEASSEFLDSLLPEDDKRSGLQRKVALAFSAGKWAGKYGTEIEQVIGPSVRRSAYRYRGTEKKPTPGLQSSINSSIMRNRGDMDQARKEMIYGRFEVSANGRGGSDENHEESPIISYFVGRLPKTELSRLQNKAGATPPSQGMIIDRDGKVATEAVGYGDDWYLPFDLKNLGRMRGGEYIRTRTYGGPTTEDVYAGMVGGARAMTVVSRSGVFTVEFDDTFRGSRRYNDNAARMVKRYGLLLDAVKNGSITLDELPQDKIEELREEAEREFGPGTDTERQRDEWVNQQKKDPRVRRRMSKARREAAAEDFLSDRLADSSSGWEAQVADRVKRKALDELKTDRNFQTVQNIANGSSPELPNLNKEQAREAMRQRAADTLARVSEDYAGAEAAAQQMFPAEFGRFIDRQEKDYEASLKELSLDGDGYAKALEALQEQFPYYIKDVRFRRLEKGKSANGRLDTGYVKPFYIRPEAALVGYYDETVMGESDVRLSSERYTGGKMTADRAFYQNSSRAFNRPSRFSTSQPERSQPEQQAREQRVAPEDVRSSQTGPLESIDRESRATSNLVSNARDNGWNAQFGSKFGSDKAASDFPLLTGGMSNDELVDFIMSSPVNRAKLDRELQEINRLISNPDDLEKLNAKGVFGLDKDLREAYQNRGEVPEQTKYDMINFLSPGGSKRIYDFGASYRPGRASQEYERMFDSDPSLERAKRLAGIRIIDDSQFSEKISDGIKKARAKMVQIEIANRNFAVAPPGGLPKRAEVESEIMGLAKLRQLNTLYKEAANAEDAPTAAPQAGTQVRVVNLPDLGDGAQRTVLTLEGPQASSDLNRLLGQAALDNSNTNETDRLIASVDLMLAEAEENRRAEEELAAKENPNANTKRGIQR
jgi:hypothetical protein